MAQRGARPPLQRCLLALAAAAALGCLACLGPWRDAEAPGRRPESGPPEVPFEPRGHDAPRREAGDTHGVEGPGGLHLDKTTASEVRAGDDLAVGAEVRRRRSPKTVRLVSARPSPEDDAGSQGEGVSAAAQPLRAEVVNLSVEKLAWLHIPKTGTSFVNILVTWACPGLGDGEYFDGPPDMKWQSWIDKNRQKCRPGLHLGCGHDEIHGSGKACISWQRQKGSFVTFLRQPEQRLMSGFYNSKWGVKNKSLSLAEYAPLLTSCQTRMLAGHRCESGFRVTDADVDLAIERLDTGFAFVGITEEWPLSVCLFHAMFGGSCHVRELWAWHSQLRLYNVSELNGFEDVHDGRLYAHGQRIFRKALKDYGADQESCDARICRVPKCHLKSPPRQNMMVKCEAG